MGDSFSINTIQTFKHQELTMNEVSDVSDIIKEMIKIKNDRTRIVKKQTLSYSIQDKIVLNNIPKNLAELITKKHVDVYDIVEEAVKNLEEFDACLREDLYDFYYEVYIKLLIEMEIESDDIIKIQEISGILYTQLNQAIKEELFEGKVSPIPENKISTYISAITAYVFYKCKFLIPIE